ncbi:substrate-binding domain-containing protein, partial [Streptomyces sp. SID10244]|nr:substrate-binding domain-containing protein [Streptomyces sp. SID10244]
EQFGKLIADGVDVIVVNAVDAEAVAADVRKAKDADIPVIAYDRLAEGPIDAFVSHDNELVGEVQGRA